jgi:cobalt-zinc-cadmium efflux system outer membrane protein
MGRCPLLMLLFILPLPAILLPRSEAQVIVIDDVILLSRSANQEEQRRNRGHLAPIGTESTLPPSPGGDQPLLEGPSRVGPRLSRLPSPRRTQQRSGEGATAVSSVVERPFREHSILPNAPLELPTTGDEGPPDGLSLDLAIDRLMAANYDLRIRFQEIPKAQADILSAGLRNNPFLFVSADSIPYGGFSPQRPGATTYDITLIQPIDVSGKHRNRILVAQQAKRVLEAQYQNSVRREIDRLYSAYVDVLEAREATRAAQASCTRVGELIETTQAQVRQGQRPESEYQRALVQKFHADGALHSAEVSLVQAKRNLATLLALPPSQTDCLEVRDSLHDRAPSPPCAEALIQLALQVRSDLAAYRLGVERARADVRLARSEGLEDVFLFYTPYTAADYSPEGKQLAGGWGLGVLMPIPAFNRNQGNVERARINVTQVQIELEGLERRVANEVQQAWTEYEASRETLRRFEQEGLPAVRQLRDEKLRLYREGKETLDAIMRVQLEYSEMVRRYLQALVHHRRSMLALNTAVGQRILP